MGLLDRPYTEAERKRRDKILSHIRVARDVLGARLDLGLTQEELGRAAGTKQSRISEIEALKGNPRFDTLDRIARVLGLMIALVPRSEARAVAEAQVEAPRSAGTLEVGPRRVMVMTGSTVLVGVVVGKITSYPDLNRSLVLGA